MDVTDKVDVLETIRAHLLDVANLLRVLDPVLAEIGKKIMDRPAGAERKNLESTVAVAEFESACELLRALEDVDHSVSPSTLRALYLMPVPQFNQKLRTQHRRYGCASCLGELELTDPEFVTVAIATRLDSSPWPFLWSTTTLALADLL